MLLQGLLSGVPHVVREQGPGHHRRVPAGHRSGRELPQPTQAGPQVAHGGEEDANRRHVEAKDYCITGRANVIFCAVGLR